MKNLKSVSELVISKRFQGLMVFCNVLRCSFLIAAYLIKIERLKKEYAE
jgi:hypothetical protein